VLVTWLLATIVFCVLRVLPGDPTDVVLGDLASEAARNSLRARLELDRPWWEQYGSFLTRCVGWRSGASLRRPDVPVWSLVAANLGPTAVLATLSVAGAGIGGLAAALLTKGPWLGSFGRRCMAQLLAALSATPLLAWAPLGLYILAVRVRAVPLPGDPDAGLAGLLVAASMLAVPLFAHVGRVGAAALEGVERMKFVHVARAKGAREARVWIVHALAPSLGPVIATLASQWGALLGGAVVLERLCARPGLGTLLIESYATRDLPVLETAVVAGGALFVAAQFAGAAIHAILDPRAKAG
jgi:ABC-type dipeptide/oligopeptide/nickel transport system permease component